MQALPCPSCATPIPFVVVNAPFCPFCGVKKPPNANAVAPVNVQIVITAPQAAPSAEERVFTSSPYGMSWAFDPRVGFVLFGLHSPTDDDTASSLRAYDLLGKRVLWEAFAGQQEIDELDYERLQVSGGNVYAGFGRVLRVLDLATGRPKWGAELSDVLQYDGNRHVGRGMRVVDPAPLGARGVVWTVAVDNVISGFDRDSGQKLFTETRENLPRRYTPFEGGLLVLEGSSEVDLVDPATRTVIDRVQGRIERFDLAGRYGIFQVRRWGWRERDGLMLHDFGAKKEVFFEGLEHLEDDVPSVAGPGHVYCAGESGAKLVMAPNGKSVELIPGFHIKQLVLCGPTLMALLVKHQGTSTRRLLGIDPQTLAVRFDLGELTTQPDDDRDKQMCTNGLITAVVTSPTNKDDDCEIMGVDPRGQVIWRQRVGHWYSHEFLGGNIVVATEAGVHVIRPDNGQVIGAHVKKGY